MRQARAAGVVVTLLIAGAIIRVLLQLPLHRWAGEGDCAVTAFGAWEILAGDPRIFVSTGVRQGALASYFAAAASFLVGSSRAALALEVLAVGLAQMFLWWLALLELVGEKAGTSTSARLLLFVVLPSPAFLYWAIYWPTGYPEQLLAATLVLWTGARLWRRGGWLELLGFGLACGIAFWMTMLTLMVSVPLVVWLCLQRQRNLLSPSGVAIWSSGATAGALPWLCFNLRYGWVSLNQNWAAQPISGGKALGGNLRRFLGEVLPTLFGAANQASPLPPVTSAERYFGWGALILVVMVSVVLAGELFRSRELDRPEPVKDLARLVGLAAGVTGLSAMLFAFSAAATGPGNIVRYVLSIFLVWPLAFALAWKVAGRRTRCALGCFATIAAAGYAAAVPWPFKDEREQLHAALQVEVQMVERLRAEKVGVIFGSYWEAYPLIFESEGGLGGATLEPEDDFHRFAERLPAGPCKWALVAGNRKGIRIAQSAGFSGKEVGFADGRWLFLPLKERSPRPEAPTCGETLARLRTAFYRQS